MRISSALLLTLVLVSCAPVQEKTIPPPANSLPEPQLPPSVPQVEPATLEGTPVADCAPLSIDDGLTYCNMSVQRSNADAEGCEQAFIRNALPFPRVTLDILEFDSRNEAKERYTWLASTTGAQHNASSYRFSYSYEYTKNGRHVTFLKGKKVVRVIELPVGSCTNFDQFLNEVYKKS